MKVSYEESLANTFGLLRRCDCDNNVVLSVRIEGNAGQPLSSEITLSVCRSRPDLEKAALRVPFLARNLQTRRSLRPCACVSIFQTREPGGPVSFLPDVKCIGGTVRKRHWRKV